MSRIGRMPITVPAGVEVTIAEGNVVTVKGPKGTLTKNLHPDMIIEKEGAEITVKRPSDDKAHRSLHGLTRTLLHNMVVGVNETYRKELEINGVGYRASKEGKNLVMNLGYSRHRLRGGRHHHRGPRTEQGGHRRLRQAAGGPVRRRSAREASSRAV